MEGRVGGNLLERAREKGRSLMRVLLGESDHAWRAVHAQNLEATAGEIPSESAGSAAKVETPGSTLQRRGQVVRQLLDQSWPRDVEVVLDLRRGLARGGVEEGGDVVPGSRVLHEGKGSVWKTTPRRRARIPSRLLDNPCSGVENPS